MESARKELAFAEYSAASGLYRQAFASLRLFLELNCAAFHFSVNELERRRWVASRADVSWSTIVASETGVLSSQFVIEFAPTLVSAADKYALQAKECYRYCSQFIHGNHADTIRLPEKLEYSPRILSEWCDNAINSSKVILFLLFVRFRDEVDLNDGQLESVITSNFNHLEPVRDLLKEIR